MILTVVQPVSQKPMKFCCMSASLNFKVCGEFRQACFHSEINAIDSGFQLLQLGLWLWEMTISALEKPLFDTSREKTHGSTTDWLLRRERWYQSLHQLGYNLFIITCTLSSNPLLQRSALPSLFLFPQKEECPPLSARSVVKVIRKWKC